MNCPDCHDPHSRVYKTRKDEDVVLRKRKCGACGHKWKTKEVDVGPPRKYIITRVVEHGGFPTKHVVFPIPSDTITVAYRTALERAGYEVRELE